MGTARVEAGSNGRRGNGVSRADGTAEGEEEEEEEEIAVEIESGGASEISTPMIIRPGTG